MKKTILLLLSAFFLCSCGKDSISPDITIFPKQQQPTIEYYPKTLKWLFVEGDTLFKDTLIMTLPFSDHQMTETSSVIYEFSFPIWQVSSMGFIGKIQSGHTLIVSSPNQTKSVTYKLLY